ncbi:MAG: hypothetical protein C0506_09250 [Anaerolinea sp.]|nr:hypothetical protein [Anaerolinea sp.]
MATRHTGPARWKLALASLALILITLQPGIATRALADPASPIAVTKTANPSPVVSGGLLTYTITMVNTGGAKLTNLVMTDQVNGVGVNQTPPALPQLTITSSQGNCTQGGTNGNVVTCSGGNLNGGATWTVTIAGQVTASNGTTLNNTASVSGTKSAQTFNTTATVQVPVQGGTGGGSPQPDLTINKTGPSSVAASSPMTYTLTVNNVGTANTANVKVVDTLPVGVAFVSTTSTSLFTCTSNAPTSPVTVTCVGGAVNAGANATITINGTSPGTAGTITNTSVVDPDNTIAESNELNNTSATVNTSVGLPPSGPLLDIKKTDGSPAPAGTWWTGAGPDPVNPGQQITYKIQVTNMATGNNSRADDVIVTDGTQGLEASSITATQVIVNGTLGNTGGCVVAAPQVRCNIRSLNSGGTLTITIKGTVISSAGSTIFNTATVTGNVKNTGVTNTASEATTVKPAVDLTITKAGSPDPVCARSWPISAGFYGASQHLPLDPTSPVPAASGTPTELLAPAVCLGGLTYSFVVGNSGIADATGVVVRDPLPAGMIFDSYSTDAGFTCSVDAGNVVTCSGGTIPAEQIRNLAFRLVAPPTLGIITNTVTVDPNNSIFEPDETNNTATTTTNVATGVDLVVWKSDSNAVDPPGVGAPTLIPGTSTDLGDGYDPIATSGTQTVTIYVDNVGTQDTTGIRLRDTLPAGTRFLSVIADPLHGFTCAHNGAPTGGVVECVGGFLLGTESEFYDPAGSAPAGPGDDFATIKIRFFARPEVGTMHNEVRVDPLNEIAEANELNNLATDETTVTVGNADRGAYHQLKVAKTQTSPGANGPVATNGIVVYDLEVSNLGTDPISNVVVRDTLPSGTRFIEVKDAAGNTADAFSCVHDGSATGGVITCTGGDFNGSINTIPGVSGVVRHITVTAFAPNTPGTITNQADVDPNNLVPEGNEFDNNTQVNTTVAPCLNLAGCTASNAVYELTIEKSQNRPTIARNGLETYTLTVTNWGSDPVSDIVVEDALPTGARLLDAKDTAPPSDPAAFTCGAPNASNVLTCTGGDLSGTNPAVALAGVPTSRQIVIRAFMPDEPGTYPNQATVDPYNAIPEGNEFNNQSSLVTVVTNGGPFPYIDLAIDKTQEVLTGQDSAGIDGTVRVTPGGPIKYVLVVSNPFAEGDAFNVTVRDMLPANTTYFSAADTAGGPGNFSCGLVPGETHTLECTGGTISANGSRTIEVFVTAPTNLDQIATNLGDIKQLLTNTAFVDPDNAIPEGNESNNVDIVKTTVQSKINLTADKEGPDNAQQNQIDSYVITVKNHKMWGDGAIAVDAVVVDTLPVGLIPLGITTSAANFLCSVAENPVNLVTCVGDLEPDQEVTITIEVFITQESGTMYNQACIDPDHLIDETSELDNCDVKTTNVGVTPPAPPPAAPNLNINKSASTSVVTNGQTFTYTISVSNVGTGPSAAPLTITDDISTLPLTFVSAVATNGFSCSEAAGVISCTSASGLAAGGSTVITLQVTVTGATTAFTNTASVPDPAEADGTAEDSVTVSVGGADVELVLANVEDAPDPVPAGSVVTYTIVVTNAGTSDANALDITQVFADLSGVTFLTAVGSQGFTCVFDATVTVTCGGNLLAGQSTVLTIRFDTTAGVDDSLFSVVTVDSSGAFAEADELNNVDIEVTTISAAICQNCIDLLVGPIFATPDPVANHAVVTFNFDVTNIGDLPTSTDPVPNNVVVQINIDRNFNEYSAGSITANMPGFVCVVTDHAGDVGNNSPEITCTKAAGLGSGEGSIASITVTTDTASDPSVLFFDVVADPGNLILEFLEPGASNTGSYTVTVDTPPPGP